MTSDLLAHVLALFASPEKVAAALAPALVVLWIVVATSGDRARWHSVLPAIGWGCVSCLPAMFFNWGIERLSPVPDLKWVASLQQAAQAGIVEELVRAATIAILLRRRKDGIAAAIIIGAAVGAGFAAFENVLVLVQLEHWKLIGTAVFRITCVTGHMSAGIILAAAIAGLQRGDAPAKPLRWFAAALFLVIAGHVSEDMLAFAERWAYDPNSTDQGQREIAGGLLLGQVLIWLLFFIAACFTLRNFNRRTQAAARLGQLASTSRRSIWAAALGGVGLSATSAALMLRSDAISLAIGACLFVVGVATVWRCRTYLRAYDAAIWTPEAIAAFKQKPEGDFRPSPRPRPVVDNGRSHGIILKTIRVLIPLSVALFALGLYLGSDAFKTGLPPELLRFRDTVDEDTLSQSMAVLTLVAYIAALIGMVPAWMDIRWGNYLLMGGLVAGGIMISGSSSLAIHSRPEAVLSEAFALCAYALATLCFVRVAQTRPVS